MIGVLVVTMLQFLGSLPKNPLDINNDALRISTNVLRFLPHFAMIWGFSNIHYNGALKKTCESVHSDGPTATFLCLKDGNPFAETFAFLSKCCSGKVERDNHSNMAVFNHVLLLLLLLFEILSSVQLRQNTGKISSQIARTATPRQNATIGRRLSRSTMQALVGK